MSEHRSEHRSEMFDKLLSAKGCPFWPNCDCARTLMHWQDQLLDEDQTWEFETLSFAETMIFLALSCVAERSPSRKYRAYATVQLLNPWWDRQRQGIELTKEMYQQLAEKSNARR